MSCAIYICTPIIGVMCVLLYILGKQRMTFKTSLLRLLRCIRIVLVIPMAILELLAILLGWIIALVYKPAAKLWCDVYMRILPDPKWYYEGYVRT